MAYSAIVQGGNNFQSQYGSFFQGLFGNIIIYTRTHPKLIACQYRKGIAPDLIHL
jgi:hypothetical protein